MRISSLVGQWFYLVNCCLCFYVFLKLTRKHKSFLPSVPGVCLLQVRESGESSQFLSVNSLLWFLSYRKVCKLLALIQAGLLSLMCIEGPPTAGLSGARFPPISVTLAASRSLPSVLLLSSMWSVSLLWRENIVREDYRLLFQGST